MKKKLLLAGTVLALILMSTVTVFAEELAAAPAVNMFIGTFWSLVPPLVAIVLALITKEVYSSLFAGIIVGAFRQGASVVTKAGEGASIEVHRGDHDDAIHNRVTVVVEERLALAVRYPKAFAVYQNN